MDIWYLKGKPKKHDNKHNARNKRNKFTASKTVFSWAPTYWIIYYFISFVGVPPLI